MAQKDISEKILESYNDVFADIVNGLLFEGTEVIKPDELEDAQARSAYKEDGKYREMERDVSKRWKKENIRIACIGLENQTHSDRDMVLRAFGYDGMEYRSQLNNDQKERYPVLTMVLYFGYEHRWKKNLSLYEVLDIPEKFKPFVNDYKLNLFQIAYLDDDNLNYFHSDFKIVADHFVQMRKMKEAKKKGLVYEYQPSKQRMKHIRETLALLSIMSKDYRFEEIFNGTISTEEETNMCELLDQIEAKGKEKGEEIGKATALKTLMNNMNISIEQAMQLLSISKEDYAKYEAVLAQS